VRADVRLNADAKAISDRCMEAFGRIDILVNNAGRGILGTVVTTEEKDWDDIVAVNLKSVFLCSKHAIPLMAKNGGGAIVNLASTVAIAGIPDRAAYVAAKGGVAALTRAMALDHVGEGIRVNAVQPGVVWSTYFDKMLTQVPDPEAFKQALRDRAPMGRVGQPEEIALAILYLASDESAFATGTMLTIDGGYTAR
jgi:NAD(P)-dependent dehydrogenase (short-subunit alcohol dehydrogenase family)